MAPSSARSSTTTRCSGPSSTSESELAPGEYRLEIEHSGLINDQLRGLYRSTYRDAAGVEHALATSQCQATDARRIFPCWDEPDFKATYRATMVVAAGLEAYSNTAELERVTLDDGRVEFRFDTTMKMSTYLLAFIAGPFEATEPRVVRGTPIRIIVPKGNVHLTDIALENAVFCFEYLTDYYGIPYPADKLDHIAIPDFAAGAMENVGLITYRDAYLVIDPAKASHGELQNCLDVIGHEVAHQWFGNLVTMAWWEGAWLNEAFASFMELKATDAMRPEWKRWLAFANLEVPWAMSTDQLASTRPIEFEVTAPTEVDQMFDAITYGKGSAVLHMIDEFVGVENFRKGVGNYLRKHAYANTVTTDLWEGLDGASEYPVSEIMDTWVYQRGFPQVDVKTVDGGVRLSQRRYMVIPDETDTTIWKVPVQLRGSLGGNPFEERFLLESDEAVVSLDGEVDWVVANAGGHGFYRTNYSPSCSRRSSTTSTTSVTPSDTPSSPTPSASSATATLPSATSSTWSPSSRTNGSRRSGRWSPGVSALIEHHVLDEEARPGFERFVAELVRPALDRLGWEVGAEDTDLQRKLRGDLIADDGQSRSRCRHHRPMPGDRRCRPRRRPRRSRSGHGCARRLRPEWRRSRIPDVVEGIRGVGYTPRPGPLSPVRGRCGDRGAIAGDAGQDHRRRHSDPGRLLGLRPRSSGATPGRPCGLLLALVGSDLLAAMPGLTRTRVVEGIPALSQPEVAADIRGFFSEHPLPEASRALEQKLELLDANVKLRERETAAVTDYFA